jgi:hypothetical protein
LIVNNKNLILLLRLMDLRENCGTPRDENGRRIPSEAENRDGDGEYFRWWTISGKIFFV